MSRHLSLSFIARPPGGCLAVPFLAALMAAWVPAARVQAATPASLALPRTIFPAGASVHPHADTRATVNVLHARPFMALGERSGLGETVRWSLGSRVQLTLHYHASLYPDPVRTAAAFGDARAALWEYGVPVRLGGRIGFQVRERKGFADVALVMHHGTSEIELQLVYRTSIGTGNARLGVDVLERAAGAASAIMTGARTPAQSSAGPADPPIFVAPAGTGPVVKSPSLMVMQSASNSRGAAPDLGSFRASAPGLAQYVAASRLVPAGGLSHYAVTSADSGGGQWYNSASLYSDPASAATAFASLSGEATSLSGVSQAKLREQDGETVLVFRVDNVLSILAGFGVSSQAPNLLAGQIVSSVPTWLHAAGTQIEDARGNPVHLAALNWYGTESPDYVVGGLDYRPYQQILQTVSDLGYNAIRLPFSNQMVEQNPIVTAHLNANPQLSGRHALDILDAIINYAGALGLFVILDNHRSEAGWSTEPNGLWYTPQYSDASFVADWATLAARYARTNTVIGLDLRNEPHATVTWGDGNAATDWRAAAERAGNAALAANPNVLIIVEGVQYYGNAPSAWWGANLMGVATAPVQLQYADGSTAQDRLVYSAHDYGPTLCGSGCPWFNSTTTYASLAQVWDTYFGYIVADPSQPYAAPLWIGEFGTCNNQKTCVQDTTPGSQGQWFAALVQYLSDRHLGWAYWSANGTQSSGATRAYGQAEGYGLLSPNWSTPTPFVHAALQGIMTDPQSPRSR